MPDFVRNILKRVNVTLDRPFFTDQRLESGLPAAHQDTDFGKVTLRRSFDKGGIHKRFNKSFNEHGSNLLRANLHHYISI